MTGPGGQGARHRARRCDADQALAALYEAHYRTITMLAVLLTDDAAIAREIAETAFVAMHAAWCYLRDSDKALVYLVRAVIRLARADQVTRRAPSPRPCQPPDTDRAGAEELFLLAFRGLPPRHREAVALRYLAGLPDAQIASVLGTRTRTVRAYLGGALTGLEAAIDALVPSGGDADIAR